MPMQLHQILSLCLDPTDKTASAVKQLEIIHPTTSWAPWHSSEEKPSLPIFKLTFATSEQASKAYQRITAQQPDISDVVTQEKKRPLPFAGFKVLTLPFEAFFNLLPSTELKENGVEKKHLQKMRDILAKLAPLARQKELLVDGDRWLTNNFINRVIIDMLLGRKIDYPSIKSAPISDDKSESSFDSGTQHEDSDFDEDDSEADEYSDSDEDDSEADEYSDSDEDDSEADEYSDSDEDDSETDEYSDSDEDDDAPSSPSTSYSLSLDEKPEMANWTLDHYPSFLSRYNIQFSEKAFPNCPAMKVLSTDEEDSELCPGTVKLTFETVASRREFIQHIETTRATIISQEDASHDEYNVIIDRHSLLSLYPSTTDDTYGVASSYLSESSYVQYARNTLSSSRDPLSASFNDYLAQHSNKHLQSVRVTAIKPLISTIGKVQISFPSKEAAEIFSAQLYPHPGETVQRPKIKGNKFVRSTQWLIEVPAANLYQLLPPNKPSSTDSSQPEDFNGNTIKALLDHLQSLAGSSKTTREKGVHAYKAPSQYIQRKFNRVWLNHHGRFEKFWARQYNPPYQEKKGRLQVEDVNIADNGAVTLTLSPDMRPEDIAQFTQLCATANVSLSRTPTESSRICELSFRNFTQLTHWLSQHPGFTPTPDEFANLSKIVDCETQMIKIESETPNEPELFQNMDPSFHQSNNQIFDDICELFRVQNAPSLYIDPVGVVHTESPSIRMQFVPITPYRDGDDAVYTPSHLTTTAYPEKGQTKLTENAMLEALVKHIQAELLRAYYTPDAKDAQTNPELSLTIEATPPELIEKVKQRLITNKKLILPLSLEVLDCNASTPDNPKTITLSPAACRINGEPWPFKTKPGVKLHSEPLKAPPPGVVMGMGPSPSSR